MGQNGKRESKEEVCKRMCMFVNWHFYNIVASGSPFGVLHTTVQFLAGPFGFRQQNFAIS